MTKKHFEAIAEILHEAKRSERFVPSITGEISEQLAEYFAEVNPRFDKDRFLSWVEGSPINLDGADISRARI
jgi:hypothetical protein